MVNSGWRCSKTMMEVYPYKIETWFAINNDRPFTLLLSAGFEDRGKAAVLCFGSKAGQLASHAIILDYQDLEANEPNRSEIINIAQKHFPTMEILTSTDLEKVIASCVKRQQIGETILVDISSMSRVLIFKLFNALMAADIHFNIVYTEAEHYYPDKQFYDKLKSAYNMDKMGLLDKYHELEETEVIYSYDSYVEFPKEFKGRPEPGRSSVLIAFLTYKRSRLQAILRAFEFSNRILIVPEPVRQDLSWRKELVELINFDLIMNRPAEKKTLLTLDPFLVCKELESYLDNAVLSKSNIYLAPLGSKMQTVGSFLFWKRHPEISVTFSQPKRYFKEKFSEKWRDTFLIMYDRLREAIE